MAATPEVRLIVRFKNDRLIGLREKHGLTQKAMADRLGCSAATYAGLENLRTYPHDQKTGHWRPVAEILSAEFGKRLDWLFPARIVQGQIDALTMRMTGPEMDRALDYLKMDPKARLDVAQSVAWRVGTERRSA